MTSFKIFTFGGFGNFSVCFGWDNGISCNLGNLVAGKFHDEVFQEIPHERGVHIDFFNEHGGSRNVSGYVIANSRRDAKRLLREYENTYNIIEYNN